jgi:Protein of unknown function (DUF3237)
MPNYRLEYIFSYTAHVRLPPEIIGPVPDGIRAYVYVTGGEAHGPKVKGTFTPVRAEGVLVRTDGIAILDVRGTLETDDGALIYLPYSGMGDLGPGGYEKFLRGELPPRVSLRGVPTFRTSHPSYLWLNRLQCLNVGDVETTTGIVRYDVYAT